MTNMKLSELKKGQKAKVVGIPDEDLRNALMEMGLLPGEEIQFSYAAPLGDPIAIQVSGYLLSIRKEDAALIEVDLVNP